MDSAVLYGHSQAGPPLIWIVVCCWWIPVALLSSVNDPERGPYLAGLFPVLSLIYLGFLRLTVTVSAADVLLAYTFGWPRRRIDRDRVISAVPERIPLWYGSGIRRTPKGWMWNVWGRDAVRVTLTEKEFLIGTDDPDGLVAALTR